jgi:hypothetical protein
MGPDTSVASLACKAKSRTGGRSKTYVIKSAYGDLFFQKTHFCGLLPSEKLLYHGMIGAMNEEEQYDHVLIRDGAILARISCAGTDAREPAQPDFFDVRTGVQLREIHPPFHVSELARGTRLAREIVEVILGEGARFGAEGSVDISKVVSILDVKQRKLDSVVADSVLDQLRLISNLLREFLRVADSAEREERFWMSQQVLTLVRKFSGRELEELQDIVVWLQSRRNR